jgi:hypothetical protein
MCVPRILSSLWPQLFDAARIRNMNENKTMLLTIEQITTALKPPQPWVGVTHLEVAPRVPQLWVSTESKRNVSGPHTPFGDQRKMNCPADIFRFFSLSIDRRLPRRLCEHISRRSNEAR